MTDRYPALKAVIVGANGRTFWTQAKLWQAMRDTGWQSQGQGVWTHPDCPGFQLQLFALDPATRRELWHRYAEQQQAPKPEEFR